MQPDPTFLSRFRGTGLKTRLFHPYDEYWDRKLGIRTFGFNPATGTILDPAWQGHYQPTPYRDIVASLRHAGVGPGDHYVDLGCGLGRTVFVAAWLGADRAVGVEIDQRLAAQCRANAQHSAFSAQRVEFVCAPAQTCNHDDTTVLFMFHPFGSGTLQQVLDRLGQAQRARPRRLRIVYLNPVFDDVMKASGFLSLADHWPAKPRRATSSGAYAVSFWRGQQQP